MKIAFFVNRFPSLSETFILNQITGLIDRGHDVDVYASQIVTELAAHEEISRYRLLDRTYRRRLITTRNPWWRACRRLGLIIRYIWRCPLLVLRTANVFAYGRRAVTLDILDAALFFRDQPSYDVVHCHFGPNGNEAAILKGLGVLKGKLVTTFHGYDIRLGSAKAPGAYGRLIQYCDAVHSISDYNRKHLEAFGFNPACIVYHPVGIDLKRFQPRPRRHETVGKHTTVRIVTVARLVEKKGLAFALHALAVVRQRRPDVPIRYQIIGEGILEEPLQSLTQRLDLGEAVEFLGPQVQSEVSRILPKADLFLLPSLAEALPVSIMEAMACALPVIATDVGSVRELVQDHRTGRLVPPGDMVELAEALVQLIDARTGWPKLGNAGRELVAAQHNIDILNDRLVQHYNSLLTGLDSQDRRGAKAC